MWCVKFNKVLKHYSDIFDYTDTMASRSCYRIVGSTSMRQISDSIASQRWSVGLRSSDCGGYLITVHSLSCLRWFQLCEMEAAITSWANGGYKGQQHCSGRVWFLSNAQLVVFYSVLFITPKPQLWYNPLWWSIWRQSEGKTDWNCSQNWAQGGPAVCHDRLGGETKKRREPEFNTN